LSETATWIPWFDPMFIVLENLPVMPTKRLKYRVYAFEWTNKINVNIVNANKVNAFEWTNKIERQKFQIRKSFK
jgi:hypothetical protein